MASSIVEDTGEKQYPIQTGYQHFKAGYRHAMHGWPKDVNEKWLFKIPDARITPVFYIKDTLGPYTQTESIYNPLELIKMKNYPKDKLFLLFFFRDPKEILASWNKNWGEIRDKNILRENLITACHTLRAIHRQSMKEGYSQDIFLYESLRDHSPNVIVQTLFNQINHHMYPRTGLKLLMTDHSVDNWRLEDLKRIWHPDEPSIYSRIEISHLHMEAQTKHGLQYKKYSPEDLLTLLSSQDITELQNSGIYEDYEYFRSSYIQSSGLEIRPPEKINNTEDENISRSKERR